MFGRNRLFTVVAVCGVLALAASAQAALFSGVQIQSWTGTGSNEALLVLDFSYSAVPGGSYAFGYRWDGAATSADMLIAMDAAGTIDVAYHIDGTYGFGLDGLSYNGSSITASDPFWMLAYPSFWWDGNASYQDFGGNTQPAVAPDGVLAPAQLGAGTRELANGFIDAWVQENVALHGYDQVYEPQIPAAVVLPEPMTLGLLLVGGVALLRRRCA